MVIYKNFIFSYYFHIQTCVGWNIAISSEGFSIEALIVDYKSMETAAGFWYYRWEHLTFTVCASQAWDHGSFHGGKSFKARLAFDFCVLE